MRDRVGCRSLPFVAIALAVLPGVAQARPSLDGPRLTQLGHYDVLVFADPAGGGLDRGKAIGVIDATPEEVFRVATDYTKYKDYMPRVRSSQILDRERDGATVEIVAELPWPAGKSTVAARYQHEHVGEIYRVRFDLVHGDMKRYGGSLYIEPWGPGQTAITYELVAQPSSFAPRYAINHGVRRSVGNFVHALRQRINDLHRLGYLHPADPSPPRLASPLVGHPRERAVVGDKR